MGSSNQDRVNSSFRIFIGVYLILWIIITLYFLVPSMLVNMNVLEDYKKGISSSPAEDVKKNPDDYVRMRIDSIEVTVTNDQADAINLILTLEKVWPWVNQLDPPIYEVLYAVFATMLGSITISIRRYIQSDCVKKSELHLYIMQPVYGISMGIIVFIICKSLPNLIMAQQTDVDIQLNRYAVVVICLFSGMFTEETFSWLKTIYKNIREKTTHT